MYILKDLMARRPFLLALEGKGDNQNFAGFNLQLAFFFHTLLVNPEQQKKRNH